MALDVGRIPRPPFGEGLVTRADPAMALLGPLDDAPDRAALAARLAA